MVTALRIASLVPSLTELVIALGLREQLVARTGFCIHPADVVRDIPKVGGTKDVNLAKLQRLAPTHVIVNVDENRRETVEAMRAWPSPPQVLVTHPLVPQDNLVLIDQLQQAFGAQPGVAERADRLRNEFRAVWAATQAGTYARQQVLYLIWRDPWMTVARDTYIAGMLASVNWHTLPAVCGGAEGAGRYPIVEGDEPWLAEVQQVLLSSEPYAFGPQHLAAAQALCPAARVRLIDGEAISWYGPRSIAGFRLLSDMARGDR